MIYYFNFGWPFICPDDNEKERRDCRRWINHNPKSNSYGSYAHYLTDGEDLYRIWRNPAKPIDLWLN